MWGDGVSAKPHGKPDARFVKLIKRAAFELRLAGEIAEADGYEPQLRALLEGARGNLRRILRRVDSSAIGNQQSGAGSQESGVGQR